MKNRTQMTQIFARGGLIMNEDGTQIAWRAQVFYGPNLQSLIAILQGGNV